MKNYKTSIKEYTLKKNDTNIVKSKLTSSKDAATYIKQFYYDDIEIFESFFVLMLNNSNITTGFAKISQGGRVGTVVDISIVAKYAVDSLCRSVIIAHNHPSGTLIPSNPDKQITKKIKDGLALFDINVLDHLILTKNSYFSFADDGIL